MYQGKGCRTCMGTGFKGRQGVFEMMPMTEEIRSMILERSSSRVIRKVATREGMTSLREDAQRLVREGKTTIDEVVRNTERRRSSCRQKERSNW